MMYFKTLPVLHSNGLAVTEFDKEIIQRRMNRAVQLLKTGIWAYYFLLIFEGALRKWVFPGLSMPLLVIRDPLALWLVLLNWREGLLPKNGFLSAMVVVSFAGIITTIFLGHGNIVVALYGARILLFHFPLIFVFASIFNREDVIEMGKITLMISIPMTLLIAVQFFSPESATVNKGIGGDTDGGGFAGALNFMRPPGTFSFTNGVTLFYNLVATFVFYFWLNPKIINRLLLICATLALFVSIPLSISRGLFFQVALTLVFTLLAVSRKPAYVSKMILAVIGGIVVLGFLSQTSYFQTAMEAFSSRFETANEVEGGLQGVLIDRYMGGMFGALAQSSDKPFFGYGLGMGTNVGAMLLTGKQVFLIAEGEWGRLIGEMGPLLGLTVILIRVSLTIRIAFAAYRKMITGDLLPWILASFGLMNLAQGGWAQPTSLGFGTLIGGLMLASLKTPALASE
ncbi:MAG: hypothetical protein NVSMB7_02780 [Chitinophagaceae bacterium]